MFVKRISHIRLSTDTHEHTNKPTDNKHFKMHLNKSGSCLRIQIPLAARILARPDRRIFHIRTDNQLHQSASFLVRGVSEH